MAKILIIDDSTFQRRLLRKFIERQGHEIIEAANGREGMEAITAHSPDCIFLDLIMPEYNGFELLGDLRQQKINIPAIVVTADVQTSTHTQCLELGATAVVNKPVNSHNLYRILVKVLNLSREAAS